MHLSCSWRCPGLAVSRTMKAHTAFLCDLGDNRRSIYEKHPFLRSIYDPALPLDPTGVQVWDGGPQEPRRATATSSEGNHTSRSPNSRHHHSIVVLRQNTTLSISNKALFTSSRRPYSGRFLPLRDALNSRWDITSINHDIDKMVSGCLSGCA